MFAVFKASVNLFPFQIVLYMKVPLKSWVANAEVLKKERKSREKQNKEHKNDMLGVQQREHEPNNTWPTLPSGSSSNGGGRGDHF